MPALSADAAAILEQMETNRGYEPAELRRFVPDLSMDGLREAMHELWIERHVERFRHSGWLRVRSTCPHGAADSTNTVKRESADSGPCDVAPGPIRIVKPEDLFDHGSFDGLFK